MKKKILCFVLAVLLILPSLVVSAAEATTLMYAKDGRIISVPKSKVEAYKKVGWFSGPVDPVITKKTSDYIFGDGVLQSFGYLNGTDDKLYNLFNLTTAYVGGPNNSLGWSTFKNCKQLTRVELSDTITEIGDSYGIDDNIFYNTSLKRIGIPNSVKYISYDAFETIESGTHNTTFSPKNLVIYCEKGSTAESFAKNYNIKYVYATLIYCIDGKTMMVDANEKPAYLASGLWNTTPLIQMFTLDGRTALVHRDKVHLYKQVGWYDDKSVAYVTMYAADGRTKNVHKKDVAAYKKVGWYDKKPTTTATTTTTTTTTTATTNTTNTTLMYAKDGRIISVPKSKVEAYKKVGWFSGPVDPVITKKTSDYIFGDGVLQSFGYLNGTDDKLYNLFNLTTAYVGGPNNSLGWSTFKNCKQLTRVELSDTITEIGDSYGIDDNIFYNTSLKRIGIPNSVKYISYDAFETIESGTHNTTFSPKNLVIYCEKGSTAESFAKNYNIKYVYATLIYCIDGKTMMVDANEKPAYLASGLWNTTPLIQMYAADGRKTLVHRDKVHLYKQVGWSDDKSIAYVTMYAADGRTRQVLKKDVAAYKKVGWFEQKIK